MQNWEIEILKIMRETADNAKKQAISINSPIVGTVKQLSPFKISIFNGDAILTNTQITFTSYSNNLSFDVGDNVILIPYDSLKKFIILDRVVI